MIKKLAVTALQVRATVVIGADDYGGHVTADVVLNRKADEVKEAMATLENLCLRTAQTHVRSSRDRMELDALVSEGIAKKLDKERERLVADAAAAAEGRARDASNERDRLKRELEGRDHTINRLQTELREARVRPAQQEGTS